MLFEKKGGVNMRVLLLAIGAWAVLPERSASMGPAAFNLPRAIQRIAGIQRGKAASRICWPGMELCAAVDSL